MTPSDFQPPTSAQAGNGPRGEPDPGSRPGAAGGQGPGPGGPPPGDAPREANPLEELTERVRAAQDAAERLVQEATDTAYRAAGDEAEPEPAHRAAGEEPESDPPRPPPRGYAAPGSAPSSSAAPDLQALVALLEAARGLLPPELRAQLTELIRELLLLLRAVIDWYVERIEGGGAKPVEVQDVPIS